MKGKIIKSTGSWYDILGEDKNKYKGRLRGKFKIKDLKVTNPIAVGDKVEFEPENNAEGTAIITDILPRENYIIRKAAHKSAHGHLIATNLDQTVLIVTLVSPVTSLGFIDRFLVSAEAFRIPAILVFNKYDLCDAETREHFQQLKKTYEALGYRCLYTSGTDKTGINEFKEILKNKTSLISGHSGVGKSTLINVIAPELDLRVGEISSYNDKGIHTTTFAEMFDLDESTFIIDTPGIKELGLFEIGEEELSHYFPEMRELLGECKFHNCRHISEPKCAVIERVKTGGIAESRYQSYLKMLEVS
ncbi:MAG: ribosome small subunit-dependent GTPase A [Cytophagaceae bacterium]|nr:ribosome small subunit-dependent GTPase A [Cytophagaceae bacterium]